MPRGICRRAYNAPGTLESLLVKYIVIIPLNRAGRVDLWLCTADGRKNIYTLVLRVFSFIVRMPGKYAGDMQMFGIIACEITVGNFKTVFFFFFFLYPKFCSRITWSFEPELTYIEIILDYFTSDLKFV